MDDERFEDALDNLISAFATRNLKDNGDGVDVTISLESPAVWALQKALLGFQQSSYGVIRGSPEDVEVIVRAWDHGRWFVPETRLCERSQFFSAALRGYFKEAYLRRVHFPKEDPDIFAFWLEWVASTGLQESLRRDIQYTDADLHCLQQLYLLGERLENREFRCDIINLVYDYFLRRQPSLEFSIETVYRETIPGNDLRRLTTVYVITVLVENGAPPYKLWSPPVTCVLNLKGLSKLVCTREVLYILATEIFEEYGCTGTVL
ncbi:hypothetical protein LPUS_06721 [Lasallia pustulata]|uniref:BTB domain-containing protein n=1 Tax=Lasallia pustulata TaxID=136370 RepID=A0A1W5D1V4_9LECA|nr:hypothetical protein LPUS_06721 [Lasallia pustulata]